MSEKCFCHIKDAEGNIYVVKDKEARERIAALEADDSADDTRVAALESGKLDKITSAGGYRVYGVDKEGNQKMVQYSTSAGGNLLVQRDADGMFKINDPTESKHVANKGYVDSLIAALNNKYTELNNRVTGLTDLDEEAIAELMADMAEMEKTIEELTSAHNESVTALESGVSAAQSAAETAQSTADGKLTMNTTAGEYRVYAINKQGEQTVAVYSKNATANHIVQRDADGMFKINDPTEGKHVANKSYVDTAVAAGRPKWSSTYDPNKPIFGIQLQPYFKDFTGKVWEIRVRHVLIAETESVSYNTVRCEINPPVVEAGILHLTHLNFTAAGQMTGNVAIHNTDETGVIASGLMGNFCDAEGNPYSNNVVKWLQ